MISQDFARGSIEDVYVSDGFVTKGYKRRARLYITEVLQLVAISLIETNVNALFQQDSACPYAAYQTMDFLQKPNVHVLK